MKEKIINWKQLYVALGYSPFTYRSNKRPKKYELEILKLLNFINDWVEKNKPQKF